MVHCHKSERNWWTCKTCFTNYQSRMSGLCLRGDEGKVWSLNYVLVLVMRKNWSQLKKLRQVGESCSCAEALTCNEPPLVHVLQWTTPLHIFCNVMAMNHLQLYNAMYMFCRNIHCLTLLCIGNVMLFTCTIHQATVVLFCTNIWMYCLGTPFTLVNSKYNEVE